MHLCDRGLALSLPSLHQSLPVESPLIWSVYNALCFLNSYTCKAACCFGYIDFLYNFLPRSVDFFVLFANNVMGWSGHKIPGLNFSLSPPLQLPHTTPLKSPRIFLSWLSAGVKRRPLSKPRECVPKEIQTQQLLCWQFPSCDYKTNHQVAIQNFVTQPFSGIEMIKMYCFCTLVTVAWTRIHSSQQGSILWIAPYPEQTITPLSANSNTARHKKKSGIYRLISDLLHQRGSC